MKRNLVLLLSLVAADAHAAFPPDDAYRPFTCGNAPMTDAVRDEPGATNERDVVGDVDAAAGLRASDDVNLYLRLRLDADPAPAGAVSAFSWGMEFDLDNDPRNYELLILVDGIAGATGNVVVFTNNTTTIVNDPTDPADQPAAATFTFNANARSVVAGSQFAGTADFFLDFSVPWSTLIPLGLDHTTRARVWAASSTQQDRLDGDFACHDGATGAPTLDGTASDPTTGDPGQDPNLPAGARLEGGGGCSTSRGSGLALVFVVLALATSWRQRCRSAAPDRTRPSRPASRAGRA